VEVVVVESKGLLTPYCVVRCYINALNMESSRVWRRLFGVIRVYR
jgi:hypothetical protein